MSTPRNIVMDMNNVVKVDVFEVFSFCCLQ